MWYWYQGVLWNGQKCPEIRRNIPYPSICEHEHVADKNGHHYLWYNGLPLCYKRGGFELLRHPHFGGEWCATNLRSEMCHSLRFSSVLFREEGKNLISKVSSSNYHSLHLFSHCSTAATKAPILWLLSVPHPYWHHFYPFHHPIIIYSPQKINIIKHCNQIVVKGAWCMLRAQTLPGPS